MATLGRGVILVDGNVLIDIMQDDATWADWSAAQLQRARATQKLAINVVILAELSVNYETSAEMKRYLDAIGIVTKAAPRALLLPRDTRSQSIVAVKVLRLAYCPIF